MLEFDSNRGKLIMKSGSFDMCNKFLFPLDLLDREDGYREERKGVIVFRGIMNNGLSLIHLHLLS